jgi:hypothetical protein
MSDKQAQIENLTKEIRKALVPLISEHDAGVVMPAMIGVTVMMGMFYMDCDATASAAKIMETLQGTQRPDTH